MAPPPSPIPRWLDHPRLELLLLAAASLHVLEEFLNGWVGWANHFIPGVTRGQFLFWNALFLGFALVVLCLRRWPATWTLAALLAGNLPVHLLPSLGTGQLSPGLLSASFLYLPLAGLTFYSARRHHHAPLRPLLWAGGRGIALLALPFLYQAWRYWF